MEHHALVLTKKISGDWSTGGIGQQIEGLKTFYITDAPVGSVVRIDCSSVEDIDYSGFQVLYVLNHFIQAKGLQSELVNVPARMKSEQIRLGLDQVLFQARQ